MLGGKFHEVVVGIHPAKIHKSMFTPEDERNFITHSHLNGCCENTTMAVPVVVALYLETEAVHFDQRINGWADDDVIDIEHFAHAQHVLFAFRQVIVRVIGNEQRLQAKLYHLVNLKITVLAAADRDEDVIVVIALVAIDQVLEGFPATIPVDGLLLVMHTASRTYALFVKRDGDG